MRGQGLPVIVNRINCGAWLVEAVLRLGHVIHVALGRLVYCLVERLLLQVIVLRVDSMRDASDQSFLSISTRQELVHVARIVCVASQLQIGRVLKNLLRLGGHEGRV